MAQNNQNWRNGRHEDNNDRFDSWRNDNSGNQWNEDYRGGQQRYAEDRGQQQQTTGRNQWDNAQQPYGRREQRGSNRSWENRNDNSAYQQPYGEQSWEDNYGQYDQSSRRNEYGGQYNESGRGFQGNNDTWQNNQRRNSWQSPDDMGLNNPAGGYQDRHQSYGSYDSNNYSGREGQYGNSSRYGQSSAYGQEGQYGQGYGQQGSGRNNYGQQYGNQEMSGQQQYGNRGGQQQQYGQSQYQGGMHSGKGPKGYSRSDDRIKEDINDRLTYDHDIDASELDITVNQGEVTLSGTVDSRSAKRRAEDIAEAISGVKNVENRIRVQQGSNTERNEQSTATDTTRGGSRRMTEQASTQDSADRKTTKTV